MFRSVSLVYVVFYFYISWTVADWICPVGNKFCFQRINEPPRTWNETRAKCAQIGGDLPGASHLHVLSHVWFNEDPFWTSLCFSNGRLQWLGTNSYEESNLAFIDSFLPDLTILHDVDRQMHCFYTKGGNGIVERPNTFGLTLKDSQHLIGSMCVSDYRPIHSFIGTTSRGHVLSASVVAEGTDIDWGPIGQNRDGFLNISPFKAASLKLICVVKTTYDAHKSSVRIRWIRNNGYLDKFSQAVTFASEDDLIPWIGLVHCEASYLNHQPVRSQGFHLVMWNTVTARLVSTCVSCRLQNIQETAKIILAQFVELEIMPGKGTAMEFYTEPPVISQATISFMIHIKNKKIDKFDFRMVQKLGKEFQLSLWAKSRSLFLLNVSDLFLEILSPCNMAMPLDRQNITWIGYLGQTVPSGNFIGGPICLNNYGEIVTRRARCGLPDLSPIRYEECSSVKIRREDPQCFNGFEPADGKCYQMTEATNFATAIAKCWVGWPVQPEILKPNSLSNWVQASREWIYRTNHSPSSASLVWLPLRRLNSAAPLQTPVWSWNTMSNRWIKMANDWNTTLESSGINALCAAYDLGRNTIISTSCQNHLPIICSRPLLSQPVNAVPPEDVGEYFCDPGWITHWLVLDTGICYKRFTLNEAIDADEAQQFCIKQGGHLAKAPTHSTRIALEQVYFYFNNISVVDSWIGLKNRNDQPGIFSWMNETDSETDHSTTYNWHPYNDFTDGYASAFRNGMWWNWPINTKLWGLICQKNMSDWKDGIRLALEPSNDPIREGEYALVFTYEPKPILQDKNDDEHIIPKAFKTKKLSNRSYLTKSFWLSDFDVVCHFTNYVRRFSFPRGFRRQYRALVPVTTTMGSGPLTCEAWLNRPAFRFQSNTIIHRPAHWYNFVIVVSKQNLLYQYSQQSEINWNAESAVNDLLQRLDFNRFRYFKDILKNVSIVTVTVEPYQNSSTGMANTTINYLVSFFLSPDANRFDLLASIRKCQVGIWDSSELNSSMIDYENILHLLLHFCLPLIYRHGSDYQFIEVRSTIACPSIRPSETYGHHVHDETSMAINHFAWPMTLINQMTRSTHPCLIQGHIAHRSCVGSFEQGAIWGPPKIMELNEILDEATTTCQILDFTNSKLYQLERMSMTALVDGRSTDVILTELLTEWEQPYLSMASLELTISSLSQILYGSQDQSAQLNRLLVTTVIERMVRPGKCPLAELQFLPDVLDDFIQLFSILPVLDNRGSRVRLNIGDQVSVVAEGIDSTLGNQHSTSKIMIDFNGLSVIIEKNADNDELSTIVTVLPSDLLAIDPVSNSNIINLYKVDTNDRTQKSILGKFVASQTTVHVKLKSVLKTSTASFMLAFKEDGSSSLESTYLCARWESRLNDLHGGWLTGDCWYLGLDEVGAHLCLCYSSGIYGLFNTDEDRTLSLALIRRLPIVINIILFFLLTSCLIIRSVFVYRKAVREMDLVELGARLQLTIAWLTMLFCHFGQYFVSGNIVSCVVLTTLFQYFLTAAFFWQIIVLVVRRWQIYQRWISDQNTCLAKLSFAVWTLSSIIAVTIPIYKWKYVYAKLTVSECWLQDPIDFGLTVAIVIFASIVSFILNMKNLYDQREFGVASVGNASDLLAATSTLLMCVAGLLVISDNSWLHSTLVSIIFSLASTLFGLIWLCTFWTVVANPMVKHKFQHSNHKTVRDLELKTVYGSSIEYLTDR